MGVDLIGHGGFSVNWAGWERLLELAREFGWSPAGTVYVGDPEVNWSNWPHSDEESAAMGESVGYHSNDGQLVTETDAAAIAAALRRALEAPSQQMGVDARSFVESFVSYCSKGKFLIT